MHLKSVVIDERIVWTGSANWTQGALGWNYEDVLCLDSHDLARLYSRNLRDIYSASRSFQNEALNLERQEGVPGGSGFHEQLPPTGPRTNFTDLARLPFPVCRR